MVLALASAEMFVELASGLQTATGPGAPVTPFARERRCRRTLASEPGRVISACINFQPNDAEPPGQIYPSSAPPWLARRSDFASGLPAGIRETKRNRASVRGQTLASGLAGSIGPKGPYDLLARTAASSAGKWVPRSSRSGLPTSYEAQDQVGPRAPATER
jgi:hypothetical protein